MRKIDEQIKEARSIGITAHIRPDGDAIGSCLGLSHYLKKRYPDRRIQVYLDPIPEKFCFLEGADQLKEGEMDEMSYDLFITLDCGALDRIGPRASLFASAKRTLCIDHHVRMGDFADVSYIEPEASSTCELVYQLIDPDFLDREGAECLYVGIAHDTGVFQYASTSEKTMQIAGKLMSMGIDYAGILDHTFFERSFAQNRILGHALDKAKLYLDGQMIASYLTREEMETYDVKPADLDAIVSQLRITEGVEVACFLYQLAEDDYKVSFRSKRRLDVATLAMEFGGGGHIRAAGCNTSLPPEEAIEGFVKRIAPCLS